MTEPRCLPVWVVLVCVVPLSCGKSSSSDSRESNGGSDRGGSGASAGSAGATRGGTGAGGASAGTAATGGGTANGGANAGEGGGGTSGEAGTGGASSDPCTLPADPGPCDGALPRFAFDPGTGTCQPFTYGGCAGNDNNFTSEAACLARCGTDEDLTACATAGQCALASGICCGPCEPVDPRTMIALNSDHVAGFPAVLGCNVACEMCEPTNEPPVLPWLFASCVEDQCVAFDSRSHEITECDEPSDCRLRYGLGCCEPCTGEPGDLVAVNSGADIRALSCEPGAACPECDPAYPENVTADCVSGRCVLAP